MNSVFISSQVVGLLIAVFWTPMLMTQGVMNISAQTRADRTFYFRSLFPIVNVMSAEYYYHGRMGILCYTCIYNMVAIPLRVLTWYFMYDNEVLAVISSVLLVLGLLMIYVANFVFVFIVINDSKTVSLTGAILYSVIFPIGQWYIGKIVANAIRENIRFQETFKEN